MRFTIVHPSLALLALVFCTTRASAAPGAASDEDRETGAAEPEPEATEGEPTKAPAEETGPADRAIAPGDPGSFAGTRPPVGGTRVGVLEPTVELGPRPAPRPPGTWTVRQVRLIVGAERLVGYNAVVRSTERGGIEESVTDTAVNLLAGGASGSSGRVNPFAIPRVAFDAVLPFGLTFGGSIAYLHTSGNVEVIESGDSELPGGLRYDLGDTYTLLANPRIGYLFQSSPGAAFWLRAGVSLGRLSIHDSDDSDAAVERFFNFTLSPALVLTPLPHTGITIGFDADIGIDGSTAGATGGGSPDFEASAVGLSAGLSLLF